MYVFVMILTWDTSIQNAPREGSDQTAQKCSLIRIFTRCTCSKANFQMLWINSNTTVSLPIAYNSPCSAATATKDLAIFISGFGIH